MKHRTKRRLFLGAMLAIGAIPTGVAGMMHVLAEGAAGRTAMARTERDIAARQLEESRAEPVPIAEPAKPAAPHQLGEADVTVALQRLQQLADAHRAEITTLGVGKLEEEGRHMLQLTGFADPGALCELLAAIEEERGLLVVDSGSVSSAEETKVAFDLLIAAWHGGEPR